MAKKSRDKGKRVERALVQELQRHGWSEVSREGWKQVRGGIDEAPDVLATAPNNKQVAFECKARAAGFDDFYRLALLHPVFAFTDGTGDCVMSVDPTRVLNNEHHYVYISELLPAYENACRKLLGLKEKWLGKSDILALKQDRKPFLYLRYSK